MIKNYQNCKQNVLNFFKEICVKRKSALFLEYTRRYFIS